MSRIWALRDLEELRNLGGGWHLAELEGWIWGRESSWTEPSPERPLGRGPSPSREAEAVRPVTGGGGGVDRFGKRVPR